MLAPPLVQDKAMRRPIAFEGTVLDTLAACPPLSIVEQSRLEELKAKDRARVTPEEVKAQDAVRRARRPRSCGPRAPTCRRKPPRQIVIQQYEGILRPDVVLPCDDEELAGCTVADVLADPAKFEGETLADPLEGVDYGRCVAKIMLRDDGTPWIHSFAHGRTIYASEVRRRRGAQGDGGGGEGGCGEDLHQARRRRRPRRGRDSRSCGSWPRKLSGVGLRVISGALKAAKKQHAAQQATAMQHAPSSRSAIPAHGPASRWLPEMAATRDRDGHAAVAAGDGRAESR